MSKIACVCPKTGRTRRWRWFCRYYTRRGIGGPPIPYENSVGDGDEGCVITKPCVYTAPVYFWQIVKHRLLRGPKDNIIFIFTTRPGVQQFMVADDFGISLSPGTDHH